MSKDMLLSKLVESIEFTSFSENVFGRFMCDKFRTCTAEGSNYLEMFNHLSSRFKCIKNKKKHSAILLFLQRIICCGHSSFLPIKFTFAANCTVHWAAARDSMCVHQGIFSNYILQHWLRACSSWHVSHNTWLPSSGASDATASTLCVQRSKNC